MIRPLTTDRLVLEPLEVAHARLLYADLLHPALYEWIPRDPPASLAELEGRYANLASRCSPDGTEAWLNWASWATDPGAYVGLVEATVRSDRSAHIAYATFPRFWRQGFAREGCGAVLRFLTEAFGTECAVAEIDTRNLPSVALVESLGFERASTTAHADYFKGAPSDEHCYRLRLAPL